MPQGPRGFQRSLSGPVPVPSALGPKDLHKPFWGWKPHICSAKLFVSEPGFPCLYFCHWIWQGFVIPVAQEAMAGAGLCVPTCDNWTVGQNVPTPSLPGPPVSPTQATHPPEEGKMVWNPNIGSLKMLTQLLFQDARRAGLKLVPGFPPHRLRFFSSSLILLDKVWPTVLFVLSLWFDLEALLLSLDLGQSPLSIWQMSLPHASFKMCLFIMYSLVHSFIHILHLIGKAGLSPGEGVCGHDPISTNLSGFTAVEHFCLWWSACISFFLLFLCLSNRLSGSQASLIAFTCSYTQIHLNSPPLLQAFRSNTQPPHHKKPSEIQVVCFPSFSRTPWCLTVMSLSCHSHYLLLFCDYGLNGCAWF